MNVTNPDRQDSNLDLHSSICRVFAQCSTKEAPQPEPQTSPERGEPERERCPPGAGIQVERAGHESPFDEDIETYGEGGHAEIPGLAKQGKPEHEVAGHDRRQ